MTRARAMLAGAALAIVVAGCGRDSAPGHQGRRHEPTAHPGPAAPPQSSGPAYAAGPRGARGLAWIPGSTVKVEQLIGDTDRKTGQPTRSQSEKRAGVRGTDLGYSFERAGKVTFLFGDTIGPGGGGDSIAESTSRTPETLTLDFLTGADGTYLKVKPEGVTMRGFEVPVSGIELAGTTYVVVKTNHTEGGSTDVSVLTRFDPAARKFHKLREISRLPGGRFVKMSLHREVHAVAGLPRAPHVLVFGAGEHRKSDLYLAAIPEKTFESGEGTRYFAGNGPGGPRWSDKEPDAVPIVTHPTIGDPSVTWAADAGLWILTYDARDPHQILLRTAPEPTGPWSDPISIYDPKREHAAGTILHAPGPTDDGLAGPMIGKDNDPRTTHGSVYAPYVIERFTHARGEELDLAFVLSTWNPYVVLLMKTRLSILR